MLHDIFVNISILSIEIIKNIDIIETIENIESCRKNSLMYMYDEPATAKKTGHELKV